MESEKVKEIKKALECCTNLKEKCDNEKCYLFDKLEYNYCERQLKQDILTLINELESENERLSDELELQQMTDKSYKYNMACENGKQYKEICELKEENKKLKDRIAELENTDYYKKIEKKKEELLCKEYGLIKYEKEIAGKYLKQLHDKLKEKFYYEGRICRVIIDDDVFDQALKEFIND